MSWCSSPTMTWPRALTSALLRYLAVAHYGRGRGAWREGEYPPHWRPMVVDAVVAEGDRLAVLWARRGSEAEVLEGQLADLLGEMASNLLVAAAREALHIEGELTLGLPVSVPLPEHQPLSGESGEFETAEVSDWLLDEAQPIEGLAARAVVDLFAPAPEPGLPVSDWPPPMSAGNP